MALEHLVRTPLGEVVVRLERNTLELEQRGGFEARWAKLSDQGECLSLEAYRQIVKTHLAEVYQQNRGQQAGAIILNLASHQLIDDLVAWTKLNSHQKI